MRQSRGNNSRSQSGNSVEDENMEEMSEDLRKICDDDDSKCARLLKEVIRDKRSFDLPIQRIQEFQAYLEKSDSNKISEQLKKILELVVHAPLMIAAITDTIIDLSRIYPQIFQDMFVDIVDILIGWYIESLPTDRILEYTPQALHKFRPFWVEQIEATTLTLLDSFIEDADNYA
ncbi:unnamed protein product [Rotaria magnacalcarata]|uniref:Uncharacterized protein n=1 Tax=Rotaria magnacalcarata TaxID=392030 RepID=A0A816ELA7_9BILA|nr:unnamed protein product [Rotaria magnacalcarata]